MATVITKECINCGACEPECPNVAIYAGGIEYEFGGGRHAPISSEFFYIVPSKCTECVGFHDHEACAAVCPVDCCIPDPEIPEDEALLIERAKALNPEREFGVEFPSRFRNKRRESSVRFSASGSPALAATMRALPGAEDRTVNPMILGSLPVEREEAPPAEAAAPPPAKPQAPPPPAPPSAKSEAPPPPEPPPAKPQAPPPAPPSAKPAAPTLAPATSAAPSPAPPPTTEKPEAATPGPVAAEPLRGGHPAIASPDELPGPLDDLLDRLRPRRRGLARLALIGRFFAHRRNRRRSGVVPHDGFLSGSHESKRERERRYGEVYEIEEWPGGLYVRMELPRIIPRSQARDRLGLGDQMPDYAIVMEASREGLMVRGSVVDERLRSLCGVSPSFPADFLTVIPVAGSIRGLCRRYADKVLEVVVLRDEG